MGSQAPSICLLPPDSAATHAPRLTEIINTAYSNEAALWSIPNKQRTDILEVTSIIAASELIAAFSPTNELIGCVYIHPTSTPSIAGLGLLAVSAAAQSQGIGRSLVHAGEALAREKGFEEMQLELLMPRDWKLEAKEILAKWYEKLGYKVAAVGTFWEYYPQLAPLLKCECKCVVYRKVL